jgi:hypothetical protein
MQFHTHLKYDDFYPDAHLMRKAIDDHFTEASAGSLPFSQRGIWNYWFIPTLYTYLRCEPWILFPAQYDSFMNHLQAFVARQFGLVIPTKPYLSMYVNGCGQNIHNDAHNGRLAYVFSLTKWKERRFSGGETFIYKVGDAMYEKIFIPTGGWGFYEFVEPEFNRLALFDDRFPHAVNPIQGTMDPHDARFVLHGHMEDPDGIAYGEGALKGVNVSAQWRQIKEPVTAIFKSHGCHGFLSFALDVEASGAFKNVEIRCMQLLPLDMRSKNPTLCVDDAKALLSKITWPAAQGPSKLVFSVGSGPFR